MAITKTITLQDTVTKEEEGRVKEIAFFTSQIGTQYNNFNINVQVLNKQYYDENIDYVKEQYNLFKEQVEIEAKSYGWELF